MTSPATDLGGTITASFRRLRRRCELIASTLPIPRPFDVRVLCELVAERRSRAIILVPTSDIPDVMGMWVATDTMDLILYEQSTTPPHQDHIILHELSHLLCDHFRDTLPDAAHMRSLLPDLDPAMVRRVLGRTGYSADEEREAELLATLIAHRGARTGDGGRTGGNALDDRVGDALFWPGALGRG